MKVKEDELGMQHAKKRTVLTNYICSPNQ